MENRWKMNRIGFVNFWLYDEEIFEFSDGKLLLRGANASGKSITTQSFIPFILDGDRTPSRLDPFGSSDRKMEYYFLGNGEKDDVTGYLFLEFKKPNTEQYRTIGIGQRAQKGKAMDFWGFIVLDGKRIGYDFNLYKEVGNKKIAYGKQELVRAMGEDNLIADKQKEYMKLVNKYIFGFPRLEQYDQFIRLMIKVRAPKLSRDFKPTKVYEILNESLQILSDEDLRAMVDAMEKMDDIQIRLDSLNAAFKDVKSIKTEYDHYNRYMLSKKALAYQNAKRVVEGSRTKLSAYTQEVEIKDNERSEKLENNMALIQREEVLKKEKEVLDDKNIDSYVDKLIQRKTDKDEKEKEIKELFERIEKHREKIREHDSMLRRHKNDVENYKSDIEKSLQELIERNDSLQYKDHTLILESIHNETVKDQFYHFKKALHSLSNQIDNGLNALKEYKRIENEWSALAEETNKLEQYKLQCDDQLTTAEEMENQCRDRMIENLYIVEAEFKQLVFEKQELTALVSKIMQYKGAMDLESIREIADGVRGRKVRELSDQKSEIKANCGLLYAKQKKARQELAELNATTDPVPKRRDKVLKARSVLKEKSIQFASFYETIEFAQNLTDKEKAMLEEQLLCMGLLDALVVSDADLDKAKAELKSLSDILIAADDSIHTKYSKLVPSENFPKLKHVVEKIIDTIYSRNEKDAILVLEENGFFKNGVMEGYGNPEEDASFIGAIARKNKLEKMILEKQKECEAIDAEINSYEEEINQLELSLNITEEEYRKIPSFTDLDQAIELVKDANYNRNKAVEEWEEKDKQLLFALNKKKDCEQKVITHCRPLPYDRTIKAYQEVSEDADSYLALVSELETAVTYLDNAKSKYINVEDLIEKEEELIDRSDLMLKRAKQAIALLDAEIAQIDAFLNNPENKESAKKLVLVKEELEKIISAIEKNKEGIANLAGTIEARRKDIEEIQESVAAQAEQETKLCDYFAEEMELKLVVNQGNRSLSDCISEAVSCIRESDKNKSVGEIVSSLHNMYRQHNSNLTVYGTFLEDCFEDDESDSTILRKRIRVASTAQGKKLYLDDFYVVLKESIESTELLIREKDRELFENILADTLSRKLSNRIAESKNWIADMSKLMREMDTSMGLTFSLDWKPKTADGEQELNTLELEKLLSKDRELLMSEDIEKVSAHFRSKIQMAKQEAEDNDESVNYADLVRDALDYRKWFEFKMNLYRNGEGKKELTNSAFNKFSGGEKAMAMYIPLFAAVNAQYKKSENPDFPRLIALDEAFAGVDDKNISSMFELVQKLDFDYIMNSQALWGCYETVQSLRIAELLRPANSDIVTVIYYYWNGKEKVLDAQ